METNKPINTSVKIGVVTGVVYAILTLILYLISPEVYSNYLFRGIPIGVVVIMMFYAADKRYQQVGKDVQFKILVQSSLIVFVIAEACWRIMDYSLHNVIDPQLGELVRQASIAEYERLMIRGGANDLNIEMMKAEMNAMDYTVTLSKSVQAYFTWIIYSFLFSFLIAVLVRFRHTFKIGVS